MITLETPPFYLDKTFHYEYNGIGNLLSVTTTPFGGTATTTTFTYGNTSYPDRLTAYNGDSILYDTLGRPIAHGYHSYAWNKDKLSRIYRGSMSQPGTLYEDCRFTYNAFGQRISKNYIYDVNPASTSDYSYTYDTTYDYDNSGRLIRELISERFTYTGGSSATRELVYLYDESGVIGVIHYVNGTLQGTYYYRRNLQGDVVGIYKANGELVTEYAYDAYGNCTIKQGANNEISRINPIRYRGYYLDRETNLYYLNARYYNPEWRRFISPDDTAYLDPETPNGLNLYCYCGNDPVNYSDPSGHESKWWAWLLSGVAIGIGIALSATGVGGILGGILIGAGASSLINGYVTESNGGNFISGYIGGAISGALCGVGAGLAGNFLLNATLTSNLAALGWYGASLATSFAGGFAGNMFGTLVTAGIDKQSVNLMDLITSSIVMGGLNMFAGIGSGMSSAIANMGNVAGLGANSQWAYRLLSGVVAGGTEAFYDITSYLYGFMN